MKARCWVELNHGLHLCGDEGHQCAACQNTDVGIVLMREAIDLPFTDDKAAWEAWCKSWAARAEAWIAEAQR